MIRREWKKNLRRPLFMCFVLAFPLGVLGYYYQLFGQGVVQELPVAVHNADQSPMSRKIVRLIDSSPSIHISHRLTSSEEGREALENGEVYGFIHFPKGFEKRLLKGEGTEIEYYNSYISMAAGGKISSELQKIAAMVSAGIEIQFRTKKGASQAKAMNDIQPVRLDMHALSNPYLNYYYFLGTGLSFVAFMLFVLMSSIYSLGTELRFRTGREWLNSAGGNMWKAVGGKLLPYTVLFMLVAAAYHGVIFGLAHFPLNGSLWGLFFGYFLLIAASQGLAVLFVSVQPMLRKSLTMGLLVSSLAFTCAGITFPYESLPRAIQAIADMLPFTHFVKLFLGQSLRGIPVEFQYSLMAKLALFTVLFGFVPLLKKRILKPKRKRLL